MKTLKLSFMTFIILTLYNSMSAQCDGNTVTFNEDDFNLLTIKADETTTTATPVTSNCIDIWDLAAGASGTDGIGDVEITLTAGTFNPNANGTCNDGDFFVSAAIGGGPLPCPGPAGTSDFGGSTSDDCVCESGYACFTYTFKNGFSSTAAGLNAAVTSSNGSTEGHESMVGWVTQGTDAGGNPIALPTVNLGAMATYCTADYNGGVSTSQQIGATGPGTFAVDQPTGITNDCATSGQSGEDTESGDNPNDNTNAQAENPNWGLNPTDVITEYTVCWIFTTAPGTDCDGDGDTGVGTNPSGSIGNITVCPAPPPCGFPEPTVTLEESCGTFNIVVGTIDESGASGTGTVVTYDTSDTGAFANAVTGAEGLPADGTPYYIQVCDAADATCCDVFGPFSITGSTPNVPTFVPCTTGTTGIGG